LKKKATEKSTPGGFAGMLQLRLNGMGRAAPIASADVGY